jgi:L-ascorbate metabolism protein UlaG (beta-lactamase superfamily)
MKANPYFDPRKPHRTRDGFRNNYLQGGIGGSFLKWQLQRWRHGLPKPPAQDYRFPTVTPDRDWLAGNRCDTTATWIGHACVLMQTHGINVLTDPVLSLRASPFRFMGPKRTHPPALAIHELPHIDVVLISHNHYDHLDRDTVLALNRQPGGPPLFLVPLGIAPWMQKLGIAHVRELDWWTTTTVDKLAFTFVPAQHWSARGLFDRCQTLWGGWAVCAAPGEADSFSFFFAGDTGYSKDFEDIGRHFDGFDLALLPIGAYAPRWFMRAQHIDPAEAVKIHQDIRAKRSMAIHWGTFGLADEPLDEPPKLLAQALQEAGIAADRFLLQPQGETLRF